MKNKVDSKEKREISWKWNKVDIEEIEIVENKRKKDLNKKINKEECGRGISMRCYKKYRK